jgi:hypothetical protein
MAEHSPLSRQEADRIVKTSLGTQYQVWKRNGLFFLGLTLAASGKKSRLNKFVSSEGYRDLLLKAGLLSQGREAPAAPAPTFETIAGTPVPAVDPADIKALWNVTREMEALPAGHQFAIGSGIVMQCCSQGADLRAVRYRHAFLRRLIACVPEISSGLRDGQPDDAMFSVMAKISMEWMGNSRQGFPFDVDEFRRLCEL